MFCMKCGGQINDGSKFCPVCGEPVGNGDAAANMANNQPMMGTPNVGMNNFQATPGTQAPKKRSKLPLIIAGVVLVAIVALVVAFHASVSNFFYRVFMPADKYMQHVMGQRNGGWASDAAELYDNYSSYDPKNMSSNITMDATLSEDAIDLLEDMIYDYSWSEVDLSFLESAGMVIDYNASNDAYQADIDLKLNGSDVFSGQAIVDASDEEAPAVYVQMDSISDKYVMASEILEDTYGSYDEVFSVYDNRPDISSKDLEKLMNKYSKIVIGEMKNVKKKETTVKASGVNQKVTALTWTMDDDEAENIGNKLWEAMEDDKDLAKIVEQIAEVSDSDEDDIMDSLEESLKSMGDLDTEIKYTVYVGRKGQVVGDKIEVEDSTFEFKMPRKGNNFGLSFEVASGRDSIVIEGSGKGKDSNLQGEFEIKYGSTTVLEVNASKFNLTDLKKGKLNGTFEIKLADGLSRMLGSELGDIVSDSTIKLTCVTKSDSSSVDMSIENDGDSLATIKMASKTGKGKKVTLPSDKNCIEIEDEDDLVEYVQSVNMDDWVKNLEAADLPDEIVDPLEEISDEIGDVEDVDDLYDLMYIFYEYWY